MSFLKGGSLSLTTNAVKCFWFHAWTIQYLRTGTPSAGENSLTEDGLLIRSHIQFLIVHSVLYDVLPNHARMFLM